MNIVLSPVPVDVARKSQSGKQCRTVHVRNLRTVRIANFARDVQCTVHQLLARFQPLLFAFPPLALPYLYSVAQVPFRLFRFDLISSSKLTLQFRPILLFTSP